VKRTSLLLTFCLAVGFVALCSTASFARQTYANQINSFCQDSNPISGTFSTGTCAVCHNSSQQQTAFFSGDLCEFCPNDSACAPPASPETNCTDGIDNDGDGNIDCADQDCGMDPACLPPVIENCTNGVDDNGNGFVDCADRDCVSEPVCAPPPVQENCNDGVDNDQDGFIDCNDQDCAQDSACAPEPPADPVCGNGIVEAGEECDGSANCSADCTVIQPPPPAAGHPFGGWTNPTRQHQDYVEENGPGECLSCHSIDPASQGQPMSCFNCHGQEWETSTGGGDTGNDSDDVRRNRGDRGDREDRGDRSRRTRRSRYDD